MNKPATLPKPGYKGKKEREVKHFRQLDFGHRIHLATKSIAPAYTLQMKLSENMVQNTLKHTS